ncbi:hypothetical protein D3C79_1079280 [compost metagenome]
MPSKALTTPPLRLASREPTENAAILSIAAVPLAFSIGAFASEPPKKRPPF